MEYCMNTFSPISSEDTTELAKSRTLETLFQVICSDNEFSLLRKTLELYCEEIASIGISNGQLAAVSSSR